MDAEPQKNSYKLLWIAGASIVVLAIIIGIVFAFVPQEKKNSTTSSTTSQKTTATVATKSDVQAKIDKLGENIKQATADQAAAKSALSDSKKQVKVGN